jgi:hypothetical protein
VSSWWGCSYSTEALPALALLLLLLLQYLVLGWAVSQRDLELLIKLVGQLISSAAADGGATIVVLTQREKLEMEELFRWVHKRCHLLCLSVVVQRRKRRVSYSALNQKMEELFSLLCRTFVALSDQMLSFLQLLFWQLLLLAAPPMWC